MDLRTIAASQPCGRCGKEVWFDSDAEAYTADPRGFLVDTGCLNGLMDAHDPEEEE